VATRHRSQVILLSLSQDSADRQSGTADDLLLDRSHHQGASLTVRPDEGFITFAIGTQWPVSLGVVGTTHVHLSLCT